MQSSTVLTGLFNQCLTTRWRSLDSSRSQRLSRHDSEGVSELRQARRTLGFIELPGSRSGGDGPANYSVVTINNDGARRSGSVIAGMVSCAKALCILTTLNRGGMRLLISHATRQKGARSLGGSPI